MMFYLFYNFFIKSNNTKAFDSLQNLISSDFKQHTWIIDANEAKKFPGFFII